MRKLNTLFIVFALLACSREMVDAPVVTPLEEITITASYSDPDTRTERASDGSVLWSPGDRISLFYGHGDNGGSCFTAQNTEPVKIVNFTGKIGVITGGNDVDMEDCCFWAVYPYNPTASCDGSSVTSELPSSQVATSGTFSDNLFISLAKSQSFHLAFYNVCCGLKFSLSRGDITSIKIRGNNNEDICGKINMSFNNGVPVSNLLEGQKEITLIPENRYFEPGVDYYIVLLPTTFEKGFTVSFTSPGREGSFVYNKPVTFRRSVFVNKSLIDKDVCFSGSNLSYDGTANCYIVSQPGRYSFEATKGNSFIPIEGIKGVKVLWETFGSEETPEIGDLIKPVVSYADGIISFETNDTYHEGNALIAAYSDSACSDGKVLWSWHIWLTDTLGEVKHVKSSYVLMDRNLGALSSSPDDGYKTYGLLYQWGRKDPFMGSATTPASETLASATITWPKPVCPDYADSGYLMVAGSGSIDYSVKNPTTPILSHYSNDWDSEHSYNNWSADDRSSFYKWDSSAKTIYDPCPPGWHVPGIGAWTYSSFPNYAKISDGLREFGVVFGQSLCNPDAWYPFTGGFLDTDVTLGYVRDAFLWAAGMGSDSNFSQYGTSYYIYHSFYDSSVSGQDGLFEKFSRLSVRCCKDGQSQVEYFSLDRKVGSVGVGDNLALIPSLKPDGQAYKTIHWESGDPSVATVDSNGIVTGISPGPVVITATVDNLSASCELLVGNYPEGNISFTDSKCKQACKRWDKDKDGEISYIEAGFVTSMESIFEGVGLIASFDELQFFVNCKSLQSNIYKLSGDWYVDGLFAGQSSLSSIVLPDSLTSIGEECFSNCSALTSISLPQSINRIGHACFMGCTSLNRIEVKATTPPVLSFFDSWDQEYTTDPYTFDGSNCKIYVPSESVDAYKSAKGWKLYANRIVGTSF